MKNNIIKDWLKEHGDPEIDKNVEKQLEIEEAAYQARRDYQDEVGKDGMHECIMFDAMKIQKGFELGAKWQSERMYTEEEVLELLHKRMTYTLGEEYKEKTTLEWFEQFKKK